MTIKIRSSVGNEDINDATPNIDSPATITAGDLLVCLWIVNDNSALTLTPPSGWTEEVSVLGSGTTAHQYIIFTKTAVALDVTNQGTSAYYSFSGMNGTDDILYGCFSLYDDAGGTVSYTSSTAKILEQSGANSSNNAPTQTITNNNSLGLYAWAAVNGSSLFNISFSESFSVGANSALYQDAWTDKGMSNTSWTVGTAELGTGDSPTGTVALAHAAVGADSEQISFSALFGATGGIVQAAMHHYRNHGKIF